MSNSNRNAYVVGLFDEKHDAETVVKELDSAGFGGNDVHVTHHGQGSGLVRELTGHGVPEQHANYYAEGVRRGGHLVRVGTTADRYQKALEILKAHGAVDINRRASYYKKQGFKGYDESAPAHNEEQVRTEREDYAKAESTLPVLEEKLHVGKQEVETGGVRIFYKDMEKEVSESITLREEHVDVDRHRVDRAATDADLKAIKGGTIEVTETSERPVVGKETRVVEEVEVGKHVEEREQTVTDTVHKQDVVVEREDEHKKTDGR